MAVQLSLLSSDVLKVPEVEPIAMSADNGSPLGEDSTKLPLEPQAMPLSNLPSPDPITALFPLGTKSCQPSLHSYATAVESLLQLKGQPPSFEYSGASGALYQPEDTPQMAVPAQQTISSHRDSASYHHHGAFPHQESLCQKGATACLDIRAVHAVARTPGSIPQRGTIAQSVVPRLDVLSPQDNHSPPRGTCATDSTSSILTAANNDQTALQAVLSPISPVQQTIPVRAMPELPQTLRQFPHSEPLEQVHTQDNSSGLPFPHQFACPALLPGVVQGVVPGAVPGISPGPSYDSPAQMANLAEVNLMLQLNHMRRFSQTSQMIQPSQNTLPLTRPNDLSQLDQLILFNQLHHFVAPDLSVLKSPVMSPESPMLTRAYPTPTQSPNTKNVQSSEANSTVQGSSALAPQDALAAPQPSQPPKAKTRAPRTARPPRGRGRPPKRRPDALVAYNKARRGTGARSLKEKVERKECPPPTSLECVSMGTDSEMLARTHLPTGAGARGSEEQTTEVAPSLPPEATEVASQTPETLPAPPTISTVVSASMPSNQATENQEIADSASADRSSPGTVTTSDGCAPRPVQFIESIYTSMCMPPPSGALKARVPTQTSSKMKIQVCTANEGVCRCQTCVEGDKRMESWMRTQLRRKQEELKSSEAKEMPLSFGVPLKEFLDTKPPPLRSSLEVLNWMERQNCTWLKKDISHEPLQTATREARKRQYQRMSAANGAECQRQVVGENSEVRVKHPKLTTATNMSLLEPDRELLGFEQNVGKLFGIGVPYPHRGSYTLSSGGIHEARTKDAKRLKRR